MQQQHITYYTVVYSNKTKPIYRGNLWNTKHILTASIEINKGSSRQPLLLKLFYWIIDHKEVWTPIWKAEVLSVCWFGAFMCVTTQSQEKDQNKKKDWTSITCLDILPGVHGSTAKLDKPQDFWNNLFQKDKAKVEIICPWCCGNFVDV